MKLWNPVAWFVARRYLFSKKSHSVINLISIVSLFAVAVPAAAMVILLSVSNGFGEFIEGLNRAFDPSVEITTTEGKYFERDPDFVDLLHTISGVEATTQYIEGSVVVSFENTSQLVTMRGVDSTYLDVFPIDSAIIQGKFNKYNMLMGSTIAYNLGYTVGWGGEVDIYAPVLNPTAIFGIPQHFNSDKISVSGIYMLDNTTSSEYVVAPEGFTNSILGAHNMVSAVGVRCSDARVIETIRSILPEGFEAKDSFEQREVEYAIAKQEKIAVYIILLFVLIVASLSLIGSIEMLIMEKREQIKTLMIIGATDAFIRRVFGYQVIILTAIGGVGGALFGVLVTLAQYYFGFIVIGGDVALVEAYPVRLELADVAFTILAIVVVGVVLSVITTYKGSSKK